MSARILPREEWHRLDEELVRMYSTLHPEDVAVVVVEDGDEIVARLAVMRVPHFESFWMASHQVGNAGVTRALLRLATMKAREWAKGWILANADASEDGAMRKTLERLGGQWLPVHTFMLPIRGQEET